MAGSKMHKLVLDAHGSFLGMEKGCFIVKDRYDNVDRYPLFEKEISEVVLKTGNSISTGALASLGFWGIDVLVLTQRGRPVAMLKALDDDSHVKTRVAQYEALHNGKAPQIAKQLVLARMEGQNKTLEKHGLESHDPILKEGVEQTGLTDMKQLRQKLTGIEGKCSQGYFQQIYQLFPEKIRPKGRKKYQAYDGVNNILNLAYEILSWKVHRALVKAKLEPFLGFLHAAKFERPSLVCDFVEIYRFLVEDFLIEQCQGYGKKDFTFKTEVVRGKKIGKRQYLNDAKTKEFMKKLGLYFKRKVKVPRVYLGKRQTFETLINEEALQFARYLRQELEFWNPRIVVMN